MASWTYRVDKIHSFRKTENGSVVIRLGARKMPLVHVDRFNLMCRPVKTGTDKGETILFVFNRKDPSSDWSIDAFTEGEHLRKDVKANYGLENLSFSSVMRFAKSINPEMRVEIL